MIVELIVLLLLFTYGSNGLLYLVLKKKPKIKGLEKLAIFFGVNMAVLLMNGFFVVIVHLLNKQSAVE